MSGSQSVNVAELMLLLCSRRSWRSDEAVSAWLRGQQHFCSSAYRHHGRQERRWHEDHTERRFWWHELLRRWGIGLIVSYYTGVSTLVWQLSYLIALAQSVYLLWYV